MSVQLKIIETTTDKLSTIAFAAGQYIIVTDGEKAGYVYYDSAITLKRECLKGEQQPETTIDWTGYPTTVNLGGVLAGSVVTGKTSEQLLYDITHPFVAPALTITTSQDSGVFQKNDAHKVYTISIKSTGGSTGAFNNRSNIIKLYSNNIIIDPIKYSVNIIDDNNATITFNDSYLVDGTADITFKVEVTVNSVILSASKSFVFVNPIYYGVTNINPIYGYNESNLIPNANLKDIKAKTNLSYSYTASNAYNYVLYDKSWGALSSIIDQNNFNITNSYDIYEITVTGVPYYLYIAKSPSTVNNFTIKFNF